MKTYTDIHANRERERERSLSGNVYREEDKPIEPCTIFTIPPIALEQFLLN